MNSIFFAILSLLILLPKAVHSETKQETRLQQLAARYEEASIGNNMEQELAALEPYLKEAARQNDMREESYARMSKVYCYYNYNEYERMLAEADVQAKFFKSKNLWSRYHECQRIKVEAYAVSLRIESALREARLIYEEAQQLNTPIALGTAAYALAYVYHFSQRNEEAMTWMYQAIDYFQKEEESSTLLFSCYIEMCEILDSLKKFDELFALAVRQEDHLRNLEAYNKKNHLVCDYSMHRFYCNLSYVKAYIGIGDVEKAELYCARVASSLIEIESVSIALLELKADLASLKGDLPRALVLTDSILQMSVTQDSHNSFEWQLMRKAELLERTGQYAAATREYRRAITEKDSVNNRAFAAQLDDLRSIYELDHLTANLRQNRLYLFIALGSCLLFLILLGLYMRYSGKLKEKNKALFIRIQEQARIEHERNRAEQQELSQTVLPTEEAILSPSAEDETFASPKEELLVKRARMFLRTDNRFCDTNLNRKLIANHLGTNEKYLADAIRQVCNGQTVNEFVNDIRLACARDLLIENPTKNLESVAIESGLVSRTTLFRLFRKHYGMSPSEFREQQKIKG